MRELTQADVQRGWWKAFIGLPEPYQNDSCLRFWVDDGTLYCCPKEGQEVALGSWEAYWDFALDAWCDADTCEPIET